MYWSRAHRLFAPAFSGIGAIFTLHHVRPTTGSEPFCPNRILDVTPEFLDQTLTQISGLGFEFVTLDEVRRRLRDGDTSGKIACFTLDDGYSDNAEYAAPVFESHDVPYTIYVATGLPDGRLVQWWQHLEDIIREHDNVEVQVGENEFQLRSKTTADKYRAFGQIYWQLRAVAHDVQQNSIGRLLERYQIDPVEHCRKSAMSWETLRSLTQSPNACIGAHTVHHFPMNKLSSEEAAAEAEQSREMLTRQLGETPMHFSYPYGAPDSAGPRDFELIRDLGFHTATTTRKGVLFPEHRNHLHALPRISLNGDYQSHRYVDVFLSGLPFALANRFRRLDVR